jgi:1,2-diacylglycerol 3-alpha-glucosyltransferase
MRIAIFSDQFYPELSGIPDSIIALGKELAKRGHNIHFYVPRYPMRDYQKIGVHEKDSEFGERIGITRFSSFPLASPSGQGRIVLPAPWDWWKTGAFRPDIIHTQMFGGIGLDAIRAARRLRVPLVGTSHTAVKAYREFYPTQQEWFANLYLKYVNWYYEKCDFVTAPSRSVLEEMQQFGFRAACRPLSNPIDTNTFRPLLNKKWLRKQFGFSENTIIFASHLSVEKNIDILIRALPLVRKKIPDAELAIAGRGPSEDDLKKLAAELGVKDSVKFLGYLNKPSLAEAYNASKMFVIASTAETQSMVTMQAMATGLPVIAANSRALPEYVTEKNGFLIEPGNVQEFAKKIIYLLKTPSTRKILGENGRKIAQKFSVAEITTAWERIYEKAITDYNGK